MPRPDIPTDELNALIKEAQHGDPTALESLLTQYKGLVRNRVSSLFIQGADSDDILQEGMIGLYKAIHSFDPENGAAFATYASTCIRNHVMDQAQKAARDKHRMLNESVSLSAIGDGETTVTGDWADIGERSAEPESLVPEPDDQLIAAELIRDLEKYIDSRCSSLEQAVLLGRLAGEDNDAIADRLGLSRRSVDNALYRARQKVRSFFENNDAPA